MAVKVIRIFNSEATPSAAQFMADKHNLNCHSFGMVHTYRGTGTDLLSLVEGTGKESDIRDESKHILVMIGLSPEQRAFIKDLAPAHRIQVNNLTVFSIVGTLWNLECLLIDAHEKNESAEHKLDIYPLDYASQIQPL